MDKAEGEPENLRNNRCSFRQRFHFSWQSDQHSNLMNGMLKQHYQRLSIS